jgi:hypothetical protein
MKKKKNMKVKDLSKTKEVKSGLENKKPNSDGNPGNAADQEMNRWQSLNHKAQGVQKRRK